MNNFNNRLSYSYHSKTGEPSQDIVWLTDIEKIKAEIEKDLESPPGSYWEAENPADQLMWPSHEMVSQQTQGITKNDALSADSDEHHDIVAPGFYKETIKAFPEKKQSLSKLIAIVLLVCIFGMGSLGFGLGAAYMWATGRIGSTPEVETVVDIDTPPSITSNRYVFEIGDAQTGTVADMVELLEPAVVSITTRFETGNRAPIAGSGTIFADNENRIFIATGHYVVPADGIFHVRVSGSRPLPARLVNSNRDAGLAVISVDKTQLTEAGIESFTIATFGNSSDMLVGDVVFAIGNARNEGISVTRGIISAGKFDLAFPDHTLTVLQTDAAINYGSSGGPLINLRGEVIGINIDRAIAHFGSAPIEGIGYSIASNVVTPILDALIDPNRPALGIVGRTVNEEYATFFGGIPAMGVLITRVAPGGAAEVGGILPYDIITAFDGEPIFIMEELQSAVLQRQIGDIVEVRILRDGEEVITLEIELRASIQ